MSNVQTPVTVMPTRSVGDPQPLGGRDGRAVTCASEGLAGLRSLARRALRWDFGARWWLLVLTGLPMLTLGFAVVLGDAVRSVDRSHGLVAAALLTAVPFALAHLPLHFIGDFSLESVMTALISLLIVCSLVRLLLGVVLRGTRDSILAVALMHTMFNRSNNEEGIVSGLVDGDGRKLAGLVAVILMTAVVAVTARHRLNRSQRRLLDAASAQTQTRTSTTKDPR